MSLTQDELMKAFVDEALDHLSTIEEDFLEIEKAGAEIDPERINKVFRAAHSIKGGAGFIGLSKIRDLAHAIETVLGKLRAKTLKPDRNIVSVLLSATDQLRRMVLNVTDHDAIDVSASMAALQQILEESLSTVPASRKNDPENEQAPPAAPDLKGGVADDLPEGSHIYRFVVCTEKDPCLKDASFDDFLQEIATYGTILSKRPCSESPKRNAPVVSAPFCSASYEITFACILEKPDLALLLEMEEDRLFELNPDEEGTQAEVQEKVFLPDGTQSDPQSPGSISASLELQRLPAELPGERSHTSSRKLDVADNGQIPRQRAPFRDENRSSHPVARMPAGAADHQSIRVHLDILDSLVNMAGELVLSRNQLIKMISQSEGPRLQSLAKRVDLITSDLQHMIMKTRMRPIGDLFHRFPRVIRDIALHLGKEVELVLDGADVELDRTVIEAINDPLVHMLRNAVDHGIEFPEERRTRNKPATGHIRLSAFSQGGQVIIDVEDDGMGIDPEEISRSALKKGFVSEEKLRFLSAEDKIRLIFSPGFSTSSKVTEWSGRGVGLDVVKANIEKLGGIVDIESRRQAGTRFRIKLPLTLAIIACQLVQVEGQRFAIPQVHIEELIRIPADQVKKRIEVVGNAEVLRLRGRLLPLIRLTDVLRIQRTFIDPDSSERRPDRRISIADRRSSRFEMLPSADPPDSVGSMLETIDGADPGVSGNIRRQSDRRYHRISAINILVINSGTIDYGLIVDSFHDFEEIVVKPLGKHFRDCRAFSGATILGDGSIALILDVNQIPQLGNIHSVSGTSRALEIARHVASAAAASSQDVLHLVMFRNIQGDYLAVPISSVVRIIRCKNRDIRYIGDMAAISHNGQDLRIIETGPADQDEVSGHPEETCMIIIFRAGGRILGLRGKGPIDTLLTSEPIDGLSFRSQSIIGSVRVGDVTIQLLDLVDLVYSKHPEWFNNPERYRQENGQGKTLLLVEDSDFFRNHVASILQSAGYRILTAADGQQGWESLQEHGDEIALVVTDIEMPRMNGYELVRMIRRGKGFASLPIIALTTLADDENRRKAFEAGVNDYQIKLDRESLLHALQTLIDSGK